MADALAQVMKCENCRTSSGPCEGCVMYAGNYITCSSQANRGIQHSHTPPPLLPAPRVPWETIWLHLAVELEGRSTCLRGQAGAVFVSPSNEIIVTGVNGAPRGAKHCTDPGVGCRVFEGHCRRSIHAEINGIIQAERSARSLVGSTMYISYPPCVVCAAALVQAGVVHIIYSRPYEGEQAFKMTLDTLLENNVRITRA